MPHGDVGTATIWLMLGLGAYHGLNPAMGWLFAVALGMQQQRGSAVARALTPIALGHAAVVGGAVLAVALLGRRAARPGTASRCHPVCRRRAVDRPGRAAPGPASPSTLGADASRFPRSGAVVVPDGLGSWGRRDGAAGVAGGPRWPSVRSHGGARPGRYGRPARRARRHGCATTMGYLATTGAVAWVVYQKAGLAVLRTAWLNVDVVWAAALVITGLFTLIT